MKKIEIEKKYLLLALIFGVIFVFIIPPFQAPDEDSHFKKAYQVSIGEFYPKVKNNTIGNYFPKEMLMYINDKLGYIGDRDRKYTYSSLVSDQYTKMNYDDKSFNNYSTATITPIAYVVPALGIVFSKMCARIFGLEAINTAYMLYFARFFSLLFSIFLLYMSIKITPVFKRTFSIVCLNPMTLFLCSVISYDNLLISLTTLALAIILKIIYDNKLKEIPKRYIITLTLIGIVLLSVKVIYFFMYILLFLIPIEKFGDKKRKLKLALVMIGIILFFTVLFKLPNILCKVTPSGGNLTSKQIHFILTNPIKFLSILFNNILDQRFFQLSSMVGIFGLIDTYNPFVIICLTYIWAILVALSDGICEKIQIKPIFKIFIILYSLFIIFAVYSAMYISWTPKISGNKIGTSYISGVQGRYFIPIIIPVLLLFSNKKIKKYRIMEIIRDNYLISFVAILVISTISIILRYWV